MFFKLMNLRGFVVVNRAIVVSWKKLAAAGRSLSSRRRVQRRLNLEQEVDRKSRRGASIYKLQASQPGRI